MSTPQTTPDERQVVTALTEVLRQQRQTLIQGGPDGTIPTAPIWQPLIDALDGYTSRRQAGDAQLAPAPELAAEVASLREETQALQHTLTVWSAALQKAIDQSARQTTEPTYGPASGVGKGYGQSQRQTLGRG